MKKKILKLFLVISFILVLETTVKASIDIYPTAYDFGEVEVGSLSTAIVTISNNETELYFIDSVSLIGSPDFAVISSPNPETEIYSGSSVDIEVAFSPSATGYVSSTLEIEWTNGDSGTSDVELSGTGVGQEEPPTSVADILAFFDASVADGTLVGYGPGKSADGRLGAMRNMIEASGDLIDDGFIEEACQQLTDAYNRCDGLDRPPEFVAGPAASTLANMILDLMGCLGC